MNIVKLNDVCDVRDGTHDSPKYVLEGYPLVTSKNITDGQIDISNVNYISEEDYMAINNRSSVDDGDILMPMIGTIGKPVIVNKEFDFAIKNVALIKFYADTKVTATYIKYLLDSNLFKRYVEKENRGGTQKFLSLGNIRNFQFPLFSIEKQNEITNELNKVSKIIRDRKEQIVLFDELIKSRFIEMFGTENEMDQWECTNIGSISDVSVGVVIKPTQYYTDDNENGVRTFRSLNIGSMYIKDNNWIYFTQEGNEKNKKSILKENDILIVRSGAPGTACVVTKEYEGCNAVDIIIARPNLNMVNSVYMSAFTNYPHGKRQIDEGTGGAAQQHFNVGKYKEMKICLPPMELQNQFATFVEQVDKQKFVVQKSLEETQTLFNSLMQKYFG